MSSARQVASAFRLAILLAAALSASAPVSLSATSHHAPAIAYLVSAVTSASSGYEKISRDATPGTVRRVLGSPCRELSPDVWIYYHYHADLALANEQACDIVVITFSRGKVADLKLVNQSAARYLAAKVKAPSVGLIAASK